MIKLFFILSLLPLAASAAEVRIQGKAAMELYDSLNIQPQEVRDEHGGEAYAVAKYGKSFGCERSLENASTYCWFNNQ